MIIREWRKKRPGGIRDESAISMSTRRTERGKRYEVIQYAPRMRWLSQR